MTNKGIDERLKDLADAIPVLAEQRYEAICQEPGGDSPISIELELLNMSVMAIFTMLGEIAKRLPEVEETKKDEK
jgi:hypothetical protein